MASGESLVTDFHNIRHRLVPRRLSHSGVELVDRRREPSDRALRTASSILGPHASVGEAGIGEVDRMYVPSHGRARYHAAGSQPHIPFRIFDQQVNRSYQAPKERWGQHRNMPKARPEGVGQMVQVPTDDNHTGVLPIWLLQQQLRRPGMPSSLYAIRHHDEN